MRSYFHYGAFASPVLRGLGHGDPHPAGKSWSTSSDIHFADDVIIFFKPVELFGTASGLRVNF